MIGGESAIDVPTLHLHSNKAAEAFINCYGYDWSSSADRQSIERIRQESLALIREELLLEAEESEIPDELSAERDLRRILIWASRDSRQPRQSWACALLRVIHTLAHTPTYFNDKFGDQIREQVLSRFSPFLHKSDDGLHLGQGEEAIPLVTFEVKHRKPLRSLTMKLLQKPENVATDVFDRLGVRFVTRDRFDALRVADYLSLQSIVMFANIKPSRSRNTLVDIDRLQAELASLPAVDQRDAEAVQRATRRLAEQLPPPEQPEQPENQFSSREYQSIQFTCRQRIRIRRDEEEIDFFFPFEVQILTRQSFENSRTGRASHEEYKRRQRLAVRRRVLKGLFEEGS